MILLIIMGNVAENQHYRLCTIRELIIYVKYYSTLLAIEKANSKQLSMSYTFVVTTYKHKEKHVPSIYGSDIQSEQFSIKIHIPMNKLQIQTSQTIGLVQLD